MGWLFWITLFAAAGECCGGYADGSVADPQGEGDSNVQGVRKMYDWIEDDGGRTVLATTLQTVGQKGWDGFTLVYKL